MFSQIGIPGLFLVLLICLIVFGVRNLPALGRSIGTTLREFKSAVSGERINESHAEGTDPTTQASLRKEA